MRCFTACCFGTNSNHKKITIKPCNNKINTISPQALQDLLETHENGEVSVAINGEKEDTRHKIANPINLFEEFKDEEEEELNRSSREHLLETRKNGAASVAIDATKEESKDKEEEKLDLNVSVYDDEVLLATHVSANCSNPSNLQKQDGEKEEEETNELSNSSASSYISYPQNHRYHCCRNNSNDEFEDIDLKNDAGNNNDENNGEVAFSGNGLMIQEESSSYESLFSLEIDSTRKVNSLMPEMSDKEEVNSPFKQSIKFSVKDQNISHFIRNPSLLKDTAAITTPPSLLKTTKHHEEKENVDTNLLDFSSIRYNGVQQEPSLKLHERKIGVDTSLSSWLVESSQDDTPNSKNSAGSVGNSPSERRARPVDRPILGALTVEDLKDEKHIVIGTVGSYLRHTGKATNVYSDSGISSH
ncbi:hypothetical protein HAX54_009443 [Datura stramonium]|uniref:Uncharacterized protein n=1 Tax=Datura stramonium TaxID=4076 RepID=A0ABS8RYL4_DATST|nr:hypothetical protein [Datura stramonium]